MGIFSKKSHGKKLIPQSALFRASMIWETWVQTCYNYERMMGMACAHTFLPVVKYLYPDSKEKQIDLMTREMEFFNVHPEFGSCILGLAISLEEDKAMGADIPNEFITNIKTSLMGPLAGVGDTIWQGVLIPILNVGGSSPFGRAIKVLEVVRDDGFRGFFVASCFPQIN